MTGQRPAPEQRLAPGQRPISHGSPDPEPLVLNVAGLLGDPPGASREVDIAGVRLDLGEDLVQASPARVVARLVHTNRGLLVRGVVTTALAETCSRCLAPAVTPLQTEIDEEVLPSIELVSGLPVDTSEDPEAPRLSDHHELDLEPLVRESIQLAEPIAPLCRPDCRGLCPDCGADLNAGPHDHGPGTIDPRLEALRAFQPPEIDAEG